VTKWFVGAYEGESGDEWDEIVDACIEYETARGRPDATNLLLFLYRCDTTDLTEATTLLPLLYGCVRNVTILAITRAFVAHYGERNGAGWDAVVRACAGHSAGKSAESDWSERVMGDLERLFDDS